LITTAGFTMEKASLMGATLAAGGTVGAIALGRLMDRFEPHRVLAGAHLVAAAFVLLLGGAVTSPWLLVVAIFGAGFGVAGAQVGVNALAAGYYPTASRDRSELGQRGRSHRLGPRLDGRRRADVDRLGSRDGLRRGCGSGRHRRARNAGQEPAGAPQAWAPAAVPAE
jgi:hypothetical protein